MSHNSLLAAFEILLYLTNTILVAIGVCLVFLNLNKGFDITDESFYILSATQSHNIIGSSTFFGFLSSLIIDLIGKDIIHLRASVGVTLIFSSALSCFSFIKFNKHHGLLEADKNYYLLLAPPITASLFLYYFLFITTPSYNFFALIGCLISFSSLLLLDSSCRHHPKTTGLLIFLLSVGGVVSFLAKPPTGAIIGICSFAWIFIRLKKQRGAILLSSSLLSLVLLVFFILYTFGSISRPYEFISSGIAMTSSLQSGHTLNHLLSKFSLETHAFLSSLFPYLKYTAVLSILIFTRGKTKDWRKYKAFFFCFFYFCFTILVLNPLFIKNGFNIINTKANIPYPLFPGSVLLVLSTILISTLIFPVIIKIKNSDYSKKESVTTSLIILSSSFLFSYIFGSNNHFLVQASLASFFLYIVILQCSLWVSMEMKNTLPLTLSATTACVVFLLTITNAINAPYRTNGPIERQDHEVTLLGIDGTLYVDEKTSLYINNLKNTALNNNWEHGTPLFDATGGTPGASVILGAAIIGTPWFLGGYKGSEAFAQKTLSLLDNSDDLLKESWILMAPASSSSLSNTFIDSTFKGPHKKIGEFKTGYRNEIQELWMPADSNTGTQKQ